MHGAIALTPPCLDIKQLFMSDTAIHGATITTPDLQTENLSSFDHGWSVVLWNDPINLMDYVVYVFQKVLHMNRSQATKHMMEVHQNGKSLVAHENREKAEHLVHQLQSYGLTATLQAL